jgi:hypothetical protein
MAGAPERAEEVPVSRERAEEVPVSRERGALQKGGGERRGDGREGREEMGWVVERFRMFMVASLAESFRQTVKCDHHRDKTTEREGGGGGGCRESRT